MKIINEKGIIIADAEILPGVKRDNTRSVMITLTDGRCLNLYTHELHTLYLLIKMKIES